MTPAPDAPIASAAPAHCATCGFMLPMAGSMGRVFGVCANESAPDDGRVVSFDHGCGAHSEVVSVPAALADRPPPVLDHMDYDLVTLDNVPAPAEDVKAEVADIVDVEPVPVEPAGFVPDEDEAATEEDPAED